MLRNVNYKINILTEQETYSRLVYICHYFCEILFIEILFSNRQRLFFYYYYFSLLMIFMIFHVKSVMTITISSLMKYEYDAKNHEFKNKYFIEQETNRRLVYNGYYALRNANCFSIFSLRLTEAIRHICFPFS